MFAMSKTEKLCLIVSVALHSLLLLWKAGDFKMPQFDMNLDPIIDVNYLEEDPNVGLAQAPGPAGGGGPKKGKVMDKIKSFFTFKPKEQQPEDSLAGTGKLAKLESKINLEEKLKPTLKDKAGELKNTSVDIGNLGKSKQDLISQTRSGTDINITKSLPSSMADSKLENKEYKISAKSVPFEIASTKKASQVLAGDKVYVPSSGGGGTSKSVRELSSRVSEGLYDSSSGGGGGALVDKGGASGGISASGGSVESRLAKSSVGGGGALSGGQDSSGSGGGGGDSPYGSGYSGRGSGYGGGGFGGMDGGSGSSAQTISGAGGSGSGSGSGGGGNAIFEITGQLSGRKILFKKIPEYPDWAKKEGIKARVGLYLEVLSNGKVKNTILVRQTSGYIKLDKLTADALLEWVFEPLPASQYGTTQWGVITFKFDIK